MKNVGGRRMGTGICNSGGNADSIPSVVLPKRETTSPASFGFTLQPYGQDSRDIHFAGNAAGTSISYVDGHDSNCAGTAFQACVRLESSLIVQITVAQDRGAILANLAASAHRCHGAVDHYLQPPIAFQINGGRPF